MSSRRIDAGDAGPLQAALRQHRHDRHHRQQRLRLAAEQRTGDPREVDADNRNNAAHATDHQGGPYDADVEKGEGDAHGRRVDAGGEGSADEGPADNSTFGALGAFFWIGVQMARSRGFS